MTVSALRDPSNVFLWSSRAMISKRVLSAVVFIPAFVLMVAYAPQWVFFAFIILLGGIGQWELYRMFQRQGIQVYSVIGMIAGALVMLSFARPEVAPLALFLAILGLLAWAVWSAMARGPEWGPMALTLFGLFYVSWLLGHALGLRALPHGVEWIFFLVWVTWVGESAAYLLGSWIGRVPLAPRLSPSKTVEGALAQLLFSVLAALVARYWFFPALQPREAVGVGLALGVIGQVGDLTESLLKRSTKVKDTGGIIPGHGGLLDRLDSLLFNTPALFYYARLFTS